MDEHVYELARCIREAADNIPEQYMADRLPDQYLSETGRDLFADVVELAELIGRAERRRPVD